eukprot:TRINITY_DN23263_c0_g1_i1.p1 TRINITY_DN23263_c0_g1~~TRINITY_DN23263_c0_g1_i1.p1  ORF type:complete len:115 (-),score=17.55 TRINITY_DN23263_c0_g1_i1:190-486(-)
MDLFRDKDQIKDSLFNGSWQSLNESQKITTSTLSCVCKPPRTNSLFMTVTVNILVLSPLLFVLLSGGVLTWAVALLILAVSWAALHVLVSASKVKKTE